MTDLEQQIQDKQKLLDESGIWQQMGYLSNDEIDCEPILLFHKHDVAPFPIVLEAPTGLKRPKYDWNHYMWVENDPNSQGKQLTDLKEQLDTAKQTITAVQEQQTTVSKQTTGALDKIQQTQEKQAEATAQLLQMLAPILASKPSVPNIPNVPTPSTPTTPDNNTTTGGAQ